MQNRYRHRQQVADFLQLHLGDRRWALALPSSGRGHETYIAQSNGESYFVKLGAHVARYQVMASLGLTPPTIVSGSLENGTSILVQPYIQGRHPSWQDFRHNLPRIATVVNKAHHSQALRDVLPPSSSETYREVGLAAARRVQQRWEMYRPQVPTVADSVDETLAHLQQEIQGFSGAGLIASHNDICNGNWLIALDGNVYLVDLEAMSLDDPAHDMGSLLWWYYAPELRPAFLEIAGYPCEGAFRDRMRVRMALHCLDILLPRAASFDRFDAASFAEGLTDFSAVAAGRENPQGYGKSDEEE
ncbi:MAG: aminoglycoside phosphotransferase family protein [Chloroflexia bacterium]|nr:aminoglycoside phosphotransferase family protein [Chloroflexia bacterium]